MSDYSRSSSSSSSRSTYRPSLDYFINPDLSKVHIIVTVTESYEWHPIESLVSIKSSYSTDSIINLTRDTKSSPNTELSHFPPSSTSSPYLNHSTTNLNRKKLSSSAPHQSNRISSAEEVELMESIQTGKEWDELLGGIKFDHFENSKPTRDSFDSEVNTPLLQHSSRSISSKKKFKWKS